MNKHIINLFVAYCLSIVFSFPIFVIGCIEYVRGSTVMDTVWKVYFITIIMITIPIYVYIWREKADFSYLFKRRKKKCLEEGQEHQHTK